MFERESLGFLGSRGRFAEGATGHADEKRTKGAFHSFSS